jgi:hypothetical protein
LTSREGELDALVAANHQLVHLQEWCYRGGNNTMTMCWLAFTLYVALSVQACHNKPATSCCIITKRSVAGFSGIKAVHLLATGSSALPSCPASVAAAAAAAAFLTPAAAAAAAAAAVFAALLF